MARMVLDDTLWSKLEKLLPLREKGGRPAHNNRLFIQHAAGAAGGQEHQALGRSRGGLGTKIHAKVDAFGMLLDFMLTGGEAHELTVAKELLGIDISGYLLADRAYDSNDLREKLAVTFMGAIVMAGILMWLKF